MSQKIGFAGTVLVAITLIATILITPAKRPHVLPGPYNTRDDFSTFLLTMRTS